MTAKDLADLVRRMRQAQKRYFTLRDTGSLEESKKLEREVDAACAEALDSRQPSLFDLDGGDS